MRDSSRMGVVRELRAAMQAVQIGRHADALALVTWCHMILAAQVERERASTIPPPAEVCDG